MLTHHLPGTFQGGAFKSERNLLLTILSSIYGVIMEPFASIKEFIEIAGNALDSDPFNEDGIYSFPVNFPGDEEKIFEVSEEKIDEVFTELLTFNEIDDTTIVNSNVYEVLVSDEKALLRARDIGKDGFTLRDKENKIVYLLSKPSDCYLAFLLHKLSLLAPIRLSLDPLYLKIRMLNRIGERDSSKEVFNKDLFCALKQLSPRLLTLRIESEKIRQESDFVKFANSFFFQLSYNLDVPIVPQKYLDEFLRRGRISKVRRSMITEIEAPKRLYVSDLIYHYQLAVASDSAPLEYLSYYHVLEYYFESVFNDDLIHKVVNMITEPSFSTKRKKDVKKIIDEIGKSLKYRFENTTFSESEALRLTLKRYIKLNDLIEKIKDYDCSLIEFYQSKKVDFSDGDLVDLENEDIEKVIQQIAARIYKTRNAIVHSKESEKSRYIPFENDKILVKEVPLIRFLAELLIIETSTETS